jgi:putative PIN family toxin of toxin-antitoxin system
MPKAVLDTTVLVSAFLRHILGGASFDLLRLADAGAFEFYLSDEILEETAGVLLRAGRLRERYIYTDDQVVEYCQNLGRLAHVVDDVPAVQVVRDPNDDMIIGCALAANADYLVSRDKDLLSLGSHEGISIVAPEAFLQILRATGVR